MYLRLLCLSRGYFVTTVTSPDTPLRGTPPFGEWRACRNDGCASAGIAPTLLAGGIRPPQL